MKPKGRSDLDVLTFIKAHNGELALVIALLVASSGLIHYVSVRRAEERGRQYDRYHKLLQDLNVDVDGEAPYVDRQVAAIYELRNFPEYWPVSLRILERSLPRWSGHKEGKKSGLPVINSLEIGAIPREANLTISFIKRRMLEKSYLAISEEDR